MSPSIIINYANSVNSADTGTGIEMQYSSAASHHYTMDAYMTGILNKYVVSILIHSCVYIFLTCNITF